MSKAQKPAATGKNIVKWEDELEKFAKEASAGEQSGGGGKFVSVRGGRLSFGGADIPGNELRVVVIGAVHENQYYNADFDPDEPQVPVCYAYGVSEDDMTPHEKCSEPQAEACKGCPLNEYGSADRGNGKACKNVRRLALIAEDDLEDLESAEVVYLKVPVMSTKNWAVYAKSKLAEGLKRPYWAVVTKISVTPDPKSQFKLQFEVADKIEDSKLFGPLKEKWEAVMDGIDFPYVVSERKEKPQKKGALPSKKRKF